MSMPPEGPRPGRDRSLSAREAAYQWISEAILAHEFGENEFLDETTLAKRLEMSRTPVREALHRLHAERYVDLVPRRGAQVRTITLTEMREVYETRLLIESAALSTICDLRRGPPPGAADLLQEMSAAGARADWTTLPEIDQRFHMAIVEHHGNAVLSDLYASLRPRHVRLGVRTLAEAPERWPTIEQEHEELVDAMAAHDAETAVAVLRQHLRFVPEVVKAFPR